MPSQDNVDERAKYKTREKQHKVKINDFLSQFESVFVRTIRPYLVVILGSAFNFFNIIKFLSFKY